MHTLPTRHYTLQRGLPGERVILLRGRLGLSMEGLARKAHVSVHTVRKVEHGQSVLESNLHAIAHALGVDIGYLYLPID